MKYKKILYVVLTLAVFFSLELIGTYAFKVDDTLQNNLDNNLKVHYIDVWQGDSTFIELPNGKTILIDGGEVEYGSKVANYIKNLKYSKIDYLFATHPHSDHIGGLATIIKSFEIGSIYMPDITNTTPSYMNLLRAIDSVGKKVQIVKSGYNVINTDELNLKVIAPFDKQYEEINNYSIVLKLTFKNKSFLFMADAEYDSEMDILNSKLDIKADVLKVGHHGSSSSTNYNFLKKVNPEIAVISVGENNDYGHPKEQILNKLKNRSIKIYRTDLNGDIVITTDGDKLGVKVKYGSNS